MEKVPNCIYYGAARFEYEPRTFCCDDGKIQLSSTEIPDELFSLFTSNSEDAVEFRKNIRLYNGIFSFTSFGVKYDKELASGKHGVYTFRAQGMSYHNLPGLKATKNCPEYFQLYFVDTHKEVENRLNVLRDSSLSEELVKKLIRILEENPYSRIFRRLEEYSAMENVQLQISKDVNLDQRLYNSPAVDQVAAIWVEGNNDNTPYMREILVHAQSGEQHRIKHYFGCYDPLQYPLLLPRGETGWHQNIKKASSNGQQGKSYACLFFQLFLLSYLIMNSFNKSPSNFYNKSITFRSSPKE